ncbi:MAG: hypothetical protein ACM3XZ_02990 [Betaproteobacteria bacterium]
MPIAVGTVGATLILMAGRFSSLSLVEGTYRVVEAGVILALSHLAGRSYTHFPPCLVTDGFSKPLLLAA